LLWNARYSSCSSDETKVLTITVKQAEHHLATLKKAICLLSNKPLALLEEMIDTVAERLNLVINNRGVIMMTTKRKSIIYTANRAMAVVPQLSSFH